MSFLHLDMYPWNKNDTILEPKVSNTDDSSKIVSMILVKGFYVSGLT